MYMCHNPRWDPRAPEITEDIYGGVRFSRIVRVTTKKIQLQAP